MIIDRLFEIVLVGSADTKSWFSDSDDSTSSCSDYESNISVSSTVTEKFYSPATNLSINTPTFEPTELKVNCQDQSESTTSLSSASSSGVSTIIKSDNEHNVFSDVESTQCQSKWCVCDKGNTCWDSTLAKMCKVCNQRYHLTCLGLTDSRVEQLKKNSDLDLICPVCTHDQEVIKKYEHDIKYRQSRYQLVVSSEEMSNDTFTTNQCDEDDEYLKMPKPRKLISRPVEVGDDEADDEGKEAPKQKQKLVRQLTEDESCKKIEELKSNHAPVKQTKLMERPDTTRFNKKRPVVASGVGVVGASFRKKAAKEMSIINA